MIRFIGVVGVTEALALLAACGAANVDPNGLQRCVDTTNVYALADTVRGLTPPRPKRMSTPDPDVERRDRGQMFRLWYVVTPDGRVDAPSVWFEPVPSRRLQRSFRTMLTRWRFTPAMFDGCPVSMWAMFNITM